MCNQLVITKSAFFETLCGSDVDNSICKIGLVQAANWFAVTLPHLFIIKLTESCVLVILYISFL